MPPPGIELVCVAGGGMPSTTLDTLGLAADTLLSSASGLLGGGVGDREAPEDAASASASST